MLQLSIFEYPERAPPSSCPAATATPPRARRDDPPTSKLAAAAAQDLARAHCTLILFALVVGPATIHELAARTRLTHVQVARRMTDLEDAEPMLARPKRGADGSVLTRPSPSGRPCRVWEAA